MNKKKTNAVAFSGLATALIVILLFLASIIDVLDYTASAICGLIVTFIIIEFGTKNAVAVYFASSLLSIILIPSKISALLFIAFCGWYSFVKRYIEKIKEPFSYLLKLLIFNSVLGIIIAVTKWVLLIDDFSVLTLITVMVTANVSFVLYDLLITRLIWLYVKVYRKRFKIFK